MITITRKSGFVVYLDVDGQPYTAVASCECDAPAFRVEDMPSQYDKAGQRTIKLTCALHGALTTFATATIERKRTATERSIFASVEERFHRDRRVQWGKVSKQ